jgi:NAD(P)-dependent dehydrogenase (short-subunit alcohol dehydrogenase family)
MKMLLQDRNAVIYGGGSIGGAVARTLARVEAVVEEISAAGG